MESFQKKRLLKLAEFLRTVPSRSFDLTYFSETQSDSYKCIRQELQEHKCGTTACAIGWCPFVFKRDCEYDVTGWIVSKNLLDKYGNRLEGFSWAEKFFGLGLREAEYLFTDMYYPIGRRGPKSVAARIERLVEVGPPELFKIYDEDSDE